MNETMTVGAREWMVQSARLWNEWGMNNKNALDAAGEVRADYTLDPKAWLAWLTDFFGQEPSHVDYESDKDGSRIGGAVWVSEATEAFSTGMWDFDEETGRVQANWHYKGYDKNRLETIRAKYQSMCVETLPTGKVYMLASSMQGLEFRGLPTFVNAPLERANYTPEVIKGFDRTKKELEAKTPTGRITIFDGPPGTGKTFMVKALLSEVDPKRTAFVFISSNLVAELATPNFVPAILAFSDNLDTKSITFIVEDADECIAPRDGMNMSAVSAVLNFGDGILGSLLDIRLVMTTNAKRQQIDPAIMRPGRLSSMIKIDALPAEQAAEVFKRLTGKEELFDEPKTLAEVYSLAFDTGWTPPEERVVKAPIGFAQPKVKNSVSITSLRQLR